MKVLWFTDKPSLYDGGKHHYHGGGWIESLERLIRQRKEIDLGIGFFHPTDKIKLKRDGTTYYPIIKKPIKSKPVKALFNNWTGKLVETDFEAEFQKILEDFKPDVIHIFGSESEFPIALNLTQIPIIVHIQGLLNPCYNSYFPINQSKWNFYLDVSFFFDNLLGKSPAFYFRNFRARAERERSYLLNVRNVMGRTAWDKMITKLFNPNVRYYHVDEILRPIFYNKSVSDNSASLTFQIVSTLSPTTYKGIDVVLKAAKQLKLLTSIDFRWNIVGIEKEAKLLRHFEKAENIMHQDVNIVCCGCKSAGELYEILNSSNVYVHPSYIDNSPNSVCEAQILGLPVIACDVGGVSSLVDHLSSGILVPSNGVYEIVHYLKLIQKNSKFSHDIGQKGKIVAEERHDTSKIVESILQVYSEIKI